MCHGAHSLFSKIERGVFFLMDTAKIWERAAKLATPEGAVILTQVERAARRQGIPTPTDVVAFMRLTYRELWPAKLDHAYDAIVTDERGVRCVPDGRGHLIPREIAEARFKAMNNAITAYHTALKEWRRK